jgi:hypothetical protein
LSEGPETSGPWIVSIYVPVPVLLSTARGLAVYYLATTVTYILCNAPTLFTSLSDPVEGKYSYSSRILQVFILGMTTRPRHTKTYPLKSGEMRTRESYGIDNLRVTLLV